MPHRRSTSSFRSISRGRSGRKLGGVTIQHSSVGLDGAAQARQNRSIKSGGMSAPIMAATRACGTSAARRCWVGEHVDDHSPAARRSPPATSSISAQVTLATPTQPCSSTRAHSAWRHREISHRLRLVREVRPALKEALSTITSTVSSVTSVSRPPMTPASATGRSPSVMRPSCRWSRVRSLAVEGRELLAVWRGAHHDVAHAHRARQRCRGRRRAAADREEQDVVRDVDDVVVRNARPGR